MSLETFLEAGNPWEKRDWPPVGQKDQQEEWLREAAVIFSIKTDGTLAAKAYRDLLPLRKMWRARALSVLKLQKGLFSLMAVITFFLVIQGSADFTVGQMMVGYLTTTSGLMFGATYYIDRKLKSFKESRFLDRIHWGILIGGALAIFSVEAVINWIATGYMRMALVILTGAVMAALLGSIASFCLEMLARKRVGLSATEEKWMLWFEQTITGPDTKAGAYLAASRHAVTENEILKGLIDPCEPHPQQPRRHRL